MKSEFGDKLLSWYKRNHRRLPWRETRDPYSIWVSEVMLQQTTVAAVLPYYEKWLKLFPSFESLAQASLRKVLKAWQGLGYYARARHLHQAAKIVVKTYGGRIPRDYHSLRRLPGFGPYTTAAVLSLAFDEPVPLVDANVRRVLMRLLGIPGGAEARHDRRLEGFLLGHMPQKNLGLFNQAWMELGALVCRPQNPLCLLCPFPDLCLAYLSGQQEVIPRPKKREYRTIEAVVAVISRRGKYLIQKRPPQGLFAELWEFPGGKQMPGEKPEAALRREIREELGAEIQEVKFLLRFRHAYTRFQINLSAFECTLKADPPVDRLTRRWVTVSALRHYPFPTGSARIVKYLEERSRIKKG